MLNTFTAYSMNWLNSEMNDGKQLLENVIDAVIGAPAVSPNPSPPSFVTIDQNGTLLFHKQGNIQRISLATVLKHVKSAKGKKTIQRYADRTR